MGIAEAVRNSNRPTEAPAQTITVDPDAVAQIQRGIDLRDRAQISSFGDGAQRDVAGFADRILAQTRNAGMGDTGKLLLDVIDKARGLDPAQLKRGGFIERLLGSAESRLRRFVGRFEDVAGQIERITIELDRHKDALRRDISLLDALHGETLHAIRFLETHILAGKAFADTFRTGELARLKASAEAGDGGGQGLMAAQDYRDAVQALDRLPPILIREGSQSVNRPLPRRP